MSAERNRERVRAYYQTHSEDCRRRYKEWLSDPINRRRKNLILKLRRGGCSLDEARRLVAEMVT